MKKSDVENDVRKVLDSLSTDYDIPSTWAVLKPILNFVVLIFIMFLLAILVDCLVYPNVANKGAVLVMLSIAIMTCVVLFGVLYFMLHGLLNVILCIDRRALDESLLYRIVKRKLKFYVGVIVLFNMLTAAALIYGRNDYIIGYGFSWFMSIIFGSLIFSTSISRYMTPAVTATLSKVSEVLSSKA